MQNIAIVGAGYGGVLTALGLSKKFKNDPSVSITLIDKHNYQLFAANLYELATAEEEFVTMAQLKKSITIPLKEIFQTTKVRLVTAEVTEIDQRHKTLTAGISKIPYNYLVVATGSESDYFNIEGAEKYSTPLKSLPNALFIQNKIEFAIGAHRLDVNKKNIRIVVAGGGYTGVEFAAELSGMISIIAFKNQYPREKIDLVIVEAMPQLIPGLNDRMSKDALFKLKEQGVRVMLSSPIFRIDEHFVELVSGEKMEYDVLVWTTGVKAKSLPFLEPIASDRKGRLNTNSFFQVEKYEDIFAIGDCACVLNKDGRPAPPTAQDAIEHGEYLVSAIPLIMQNKKPAAYVGVKHGFIVTLGGRWAILSFEPFYIKGVFAYVARELAHVNYYRKVVGIWKAIKYVWFQVDLYGRND